MSLSGKYTSSFEIVRNIIRDLGSNTNDIPWTDAIEWIAEAIDLVGAPHGKQNKIACITIDNFRGELPCDFDSITQVSGLAGCVQFPMRGSDNSFHPVFTCDNTTTGCSTCNGTFAPGSSLIDTNTPIGEDSDGNPTFNFMNDSNVSLPQAIAGNFPTLSNCDDATYTLNDNFIFTSFKDTFKVLIAYKAFPIDTNGFPLVPDDIKYKQAVQTYVRMKVDYILWRRGDIARDIFEYSEREWMWYVGAAGTKARIPSYDSMESMKNSILRLIPRINQHQNFFARLGQQEMLTFGRKY